VVSAAKAREVCNPMCVCDSLIPMTMCLSGNI
jgi:hypothetical protein